MAPSEALLVRITGELPPPKKQSNGNTLKVLHGLFLQAISHRTSLMKLDIYEFLRLTLKSLFVLRDIKE